MQMTALYDLLFLHYNGQREKQEKITEKIYKKNLTYLSSDYVYFIDERNLKADWTISLC